MRLLVKTMLGVLLLIALLALTVMLRPVEASAVIWPIVESMNLDEYRGITTDGQVQPGLFPVRATGVSTAPVREAANALLATLTDAQRADVMFAVTDDEWRRWANIHISARRGVGFADMTAAQQDAVWALLAAGLSNKGYALARDVVRLEEHLAELMDDHYQYGEHRYWITMMGEPSATEPWGWQFEGHHLIINYFVLGDQVVMTPTFVGSEPIRAVSGKYAGTEILQAEQELGLALMNALPEPQRMAATVALEKPGNNNYAELFSDNVVVPVQGLNLAAVQGDTVALAEQLIRTYVDNLRPGHADVLMEDIRAHWSATHFAWVGPHDAEAVFYYRIQSPVFMIEFDHQGPVALAGDGPSRNHIHAVMRTPNGNDYGKSLLAQHLALKHSP